MNKPGDIIQVNGKDYKITEASMPNRRCCMCQANNNPIPCFIGGWAPTNEWTQQRCLEEVPHNCYLRPYSK